MQSVRKHPCLDALGAQQGNDLVARFGTGAYLRHGQHKSQGLVINLDSSAQNLPREINGSPDLFGNGTAPIDNVCELGHLGAADCSMEFGHPGVGPAIAKDPWFVLAVIAQCSHCAAETPVARHDHSALTSCDDFARVKAQDPDVAQKSARQTIEHATECTRGVFHKFDVAGDSTHCRDIGRYTELVYGHDGAGLRGEHIGDPVWVNVPAV